MSQVRTENLVAGALGASPVAAHGAPKEHAGPLTRRPRSTTRRDRAIARKGTSRRRVRFVRRGIPVVVRIHPPARTGNDSVISAIANVIRDAIAADDDEESEAVAPNRVGRRMALLRTRNTRHGDCRTRTPAA